MKTLKDFIGFSMLLAGILLGGWFFTIIRNDFLPSSLFDNMFSEWLDTILILAIYGIMIGIYCFIYGLFEKHDNLKKQKAIVIMQPSQAEDAYLKSADQIDSEEAIHCIIESKNSPTPLKEVLKQQEQDMKNSSDEGYDDQQAHVSESRKDKEEKARRAMKMIASNIINRLSQEEITALKKNNLLNFDYLLWYSRNVLKYQEEFLEDVKAILDPPSHQR